MTGVGEGGAVGQFGVASGSGMVVQAGRDAHVHRHEVERRPVWPVRVGVPPQVVNHYQDRDATRRVIRALAEGRAAVLVGSSSAGGVVVSGLGGVGKSQLAAHYAWSAWRDTSTDVAVWVSALSRDAILTAYAEAARRVLCEQDPGIAGRAPEEAARSLMTWLSTTGRRWLVVLDDVRDPHDVRGMWPPPSGTGGVVVTTRRRDAAFGLARRSVIELGAYTEEEAVDYLGRALSRRAGDHAGAAQLHGLAEDLARLPLALAQAVAFLLDRPLLTIADYRRRLGDRRHTLADVLPGSAELPDQHEATVAATWSLSIERADRLAPRGLARPLLEVASLLDPNGIPLAVFTGAAVRDHLNATTGREIDTTTVQDGLACLHRFHLVTLSPARPHRTVAVHALVQRAVRDTIDPDLLHRLVRTTADALHATWPDIDTLDPEHAQALRSNTDALHAHTRPVLWTPEPHPVLDRAGRSLGDAGQVRAVIAYWRGLRDQARTHLGPDHPETMTMRYNLAHWSGEAGDPAGAAAELEELLIDRSRVLGPDHPQTLRTRANLACRRGEAGDPARAVVEFEALLADRVRVLGPDHPDTLNTRVDLAFWRGEAGDSAGAVAGLEMALADRARVLGPDHPRTLGTRAALAYRHGETSGPARAAAEFEALLADRVRVLGPDHPDTLDTRADLACWRGEAGDPARAAAELEELLIDRLRVLDAGHLGVLFTRHNLALWRGRAGDPAGAAVEFEALFGDCARVLGPDHPHTLTTKANAAHWRYRSDERSPHSP